MPSTPASAANTASYIGPVANLAQEQEHLLTATH